MLTYVHRVAAVSGGSVLAAHLVLNWERYTGDANDFDSASREIITFVKSDVRGRIVRRWILAWLLIVPRLLKGRYWTFSNLLQTEYQRLYGDARLEDLYSQSTSSRPQVFLNCTSLSTGSPCCFGRSGFMWYEDELEKSIASPETQISFAVAASSAFPPLFPPIAVSNTVLFCDRSQFPNPHYLTDGGVYDNLGIDRLLWYHRQTNDTDFFLVSDAEGNFDWDFDARYAFITGRNIRASDLLMKRVSVLEYASLSSLEAKTVAIKIGHELQRAGDTTVLSPEIQRSLRNIRTDLDAFSNNEINCLVQRGYTVAREMAIGKGLVSGAPAFSWKPTVTAREMDAPSLRHIRKSKERRLRLWSYRDWASWASLFAVSAIGLGLLGPPYLHQRRLTSELKKKTNLNSQLNNELAAQSSLNNRLNTVAIDYFKQSHRPIQPGISAAPYNSTAETICCIVRRRGDDADTFIILSGFGLKDESSVGDAVLQPGPFDGGKMPADLIAHISKFVRVSSKAPNLAAGALAKLIPSVSATNSVAGFGPVRGIAQKVEPGQEMFIAGRTSGLAQVFVSATSLDNVTIALESRDVVFNGLIELRAATGSASRGGDGGAPVFTKDGRLVGIVIASSDVMSFVIPIQRVFDALEVELAQ